MPSQVLGVVWLGRYLAWCGWGEGSREIDGRRWQAAGGGKRWQAVAGGGRKSQVVSFSVVGKLLHHLPTHQTNKPPTKPRHHETTDPPTLVVECTTKSAPSSIGRTSAGVSHVASTTTTASAASSVAALTAARTRLATSGTFVTLSNGLVWFGGSVGGLVGGWVVWWVGWRVGWWFGGWFGDLEQRIGRRLHPCNHARRRGGGAGGSCLNGLYVGIVHWFEAVGGRGRAARWEGGMAARWHGGLASWRHGGMESQVRQASETCSAQGRRTAIRCPCRQMPPPS